MIRIPPPEELARRPVVPAVALAALDGAGKIVLAAGMVAAGTFMAAAIVWTTFRFGRSVSLAVDRWTEGGWQIVQDMPSPPALAAGLAGGIALLFVFGGAGTACEWLAERAGRTLSATASITGCVAWWAAVCGAVWALT